jgi:hypothetical protein
MTGRSLLPRLGIGRSVRRGAPDRLALDELAGEPDHLMGDAIHQEAVADQHMGRTR